MGLQPDGGPVEPKAEVATPKKPRHAKRIGADNVQWSRGEALRTPVFWLIASTFGVAQIGVTGLAVIDTGKDLNLAGQLILLGCIQVGGLGIMTFSSVVFFLVGKKVSYRGRVALQETIAGTHGDVRALDAASSVLPR